MQNIKNTINALREEIIKHDRLYGEGNPIISDSEYDEKYYKLLELERVNPEFSSKDSPTQKIYAIEKSSNAAKIIHPEPMLSMDKAVTIDKIRKFIKDMNDLAEKSGIKNKKLLMMKKYDGLTVVVKYNKKIIKQAVTRGDGFQGENCIHAILNTQNLPKLINFEDELEFRGEAVIPYADYERINVNGDYKGIRNLAAGTITTLSGAIAKERNLQIHGFYLVSAGNIEFETASEQLDFLKSQNIPSGSYSTYDISNKEDVEKLIQDIERYNDEVRPNLDYQIDGLILEMDSLELREIAGYTTKYPRWAIAYKFKPIDATTTLSSVEWTIGKTGQCCPKGILNPPVDIDGATISQASLANMDNIVKRNIKLNDTVLVIKAHDVIPQITSSIKENRTGKEINIEPPTECPSCGSKLINVGANIICPNHIDCPAQLNRKIRQFCSRDALNIEGLGNKAVDQFLDAGLINSISDIYLLKDKIEELSKLEKFGEKKIDNLLNAIEKSKEAPLSKVLYGLTIKNVGENSSKNLAKKFKTMDSILEKAKDEVAFYNEVLTLTDFGDESARSIADYFSNVDNRLLIMTLKSYGFQMIEDVQETTESIFTGKTIVVTGTLKNYSRGTIKTKIESLGAKAAGSVSKKTDYVLYGEEAGSKYDKAIELGIKVITEKEFENMLL